MPANVKIATVDAFENSELAMRFGVQSIPLLVLFKDGQEVDRKVGFQAKSQLTSWVKSKA